jgi:hypothetical protein
MARSMWMVDPLAQEDTRNEIIRVVGEAGRLAKAATQLCAYSKEQMHSVRTGLISERERVQMAQRNVASAVVRMTDHLRTRSPLQRHSPTIQHSRRRGGREGGSGSGSTQHEPSPLDVGQSPGPGGPALGRWPPAQGRRGGGGGSRVAV